MTQSIDARGLRCPWPAVRLARALREGATDIEIIADDPAAATELAAVATAADATIQQIDDGDIHKYRVVRAN
jgi:tRNA 2-thiouridine synthesizing protein A